MSSHKIIISLVFLFQACTMSAMNPLRKPLKALLAESQNLQKAIQEKQQDIINDINRITNSSYQLNSGDVNRASLLLDDIKIAQQNGLLRAIPLEKINAVGIILQKGEQPTQEPAMTKEKFIAKKQSLINEINRITQPGYAITAGDVNNARYLLNSIDFAQKNAIPFLISQKQFNFLKELAQSGQQLEKRRKEREEAQRAPKGTAELWQTPLEELVMESIMNPENESLKKLIEEKKSDIARILDAIVDRDRDRGRFSPDLFRRAKSLAADSEFARQNGLLTVTQEQIDRLNDMAKQQAELDAMTRKK